MQCSNEGGEVVEIGGARLHERNNESLTGENKEYNSSNY